MIDGLVGAAAPVQLQLKDGMTGLFPQATLKNAAGVVLATVNLSDVGDGLYVSTYTFTLPGYYYATFKVYTDAGYTILSQIYDILTDPYNISNLPAIQAAQAAAIWNTPLSPFTTPDSAGYRVVNLPVGIPQAVWAQDINAYTDHNSAGYILYQVSPDRFLSAIASAVWDAPVAPHMIPNTFGDWVAAIHQWSQVTNNEVVDVSHGLAAIRADVDNQATAILAKESQTQTLVGQVPAAVVGVVLGPEGHTVSDTYDKINFTGIAKTNDPRFNNLDVPVSSRSTIAVADIWAYAQRTITDFTLPEPAVKLIWDYLVSQANVPGSIGARIGLNLDAQVSSRSTQAQVAEELAGVLTDSELAAALGPIITELNQATVALTLLTTLTEAIKPKTDLIPGTPAQDPTVINATNAIEVLIQSLTNLTQNVKTDTGRIPAEPARVSDVAAIPTNPLLASDARLGNLDARVSLTSRLQPSDLAPLAKTVDLDAAVVTLETQGNQTQFLIQETQAAIGQLPNNSALAAGLAPLVTSIQLTAAESALLLAISEISAGGSGATPAQIWSYATRTLTTGFPDISQLATKTDLEALAQTQYVNQMTTTFRNATQDQEVVVWAEKDGARVTSSSSAAIQVRDSSGTTVWGGTLSTPNADGIFRFLNPIVVSEDQNYYIVISIIVDGVARVNQRSFFTVG